MPFGSLHSRAVVIQRRQRRSGIARGGGQVASTARRVRACTLGRHRHLLARLLQPSQRLHVALQLVRAALGEEGCAAVQRADHSRPRRRLGRCAPALTCPLLAPPHCSAVRVALGVQLPLQGAHAGLELGGGGWRRQ